MSPGFQSRVSTNPGLAANQLRTRADVAAALLALWAPLEPHFSPGAARVTLGHTGASFDDRAAQLEGFSRPLWGLVPFAAGGGAFQHWDRYRLGLTNGADPSHPEYWGDPADYDQRLVEMAAIGFGLALIPDILWDPLTAAAKKNLAAWLGQINHHTVYDDNWYFFRVLVNLGLARVGVPHDAAMITADLDRLESFYLGDGWYADGPLPQQDYYVAWAMHFYGLLYANVNAVQDPARAKRFRDRAATFARDFIHWFAPDGSGLPFGRSLTYRFAQGAFWAALAFAGVEALPWGVLKGLWLRNLRWWLTQPILAPDGVLTIGYAYPNLLMAEDYNSPGSPYWALKTFLPLALLESHPFWRAEEAPLPDLPEIQPLPHAGMIVCRDAAAGHVFALSSGQSAPSVRHGEAKYAKLVYSTAFAFSVPSAQLELHRGAYDSTLALSEDRIHYRTREDVTASEFRGESLWSRWRPWPDVEIETWLIPALPWHIRVHRLRTARPLHSAEGGFAIPHSSDPTIQLAEPAAALAVSPAAWSGLRDLQGHRSGQLITPSPNTNLLYPRTILPTLIGEHAPGDHWLISAVIAQPDPANWQSIWYAPPDPPSLEERP